MKTDELQAPADEEIARYAYHLWESEGRQHGRDMDYWMQAKAHLIARRKHDAGLLKQAAQKKPAPRENQVATPTAKEVKPVRQRGQDRPGSPRAYA